MNYLNIALKIFIINEYAKSDEFFNRRLQDLADGVGLYQEAVMAVDSRNLEIAGSLPRAAFKPPRPRPKLLLST